MRKFKYQATKIIFVISLVFSHGAILSQEDINSSQNHVPNIIPPSPSVSGLMKFEEIPVSNYTGVPDISIPLFSESGYFGLNINVGLSYHTSSVKKNDVASSSGLGWNLMAGGTISRTVMGIPDEFYEPSSGKCGIYHASNNFYNVLNLLESNSLNEQDFLKHVETNRLMFEANEKQTYDTKHDLYQYNFMGKSGRFILKKTLSGFVVVKFDYNNLKIEYIAENHFEITDEQGFKYKFNIKEYSSSGSASLASYAGGVVSENLSFNYEYVSAYHLSEVKKDSVTLVQFQYTDESAAENFREGVRVGATTINQLQNREIEIATFFAQNINYPTPVGIVQPIQNLSFNNVITKAKKLKNIQITNKASIVFNYNKGSRNDLNMLSLANAAHLNSIIIKDINDNQVKKYEFEYDFLHKMFLKEIKETSTNDNSIQKYKFEYDRPWLNPNDYITDYWGYYKTSFCNEYVDGREVDKSMLTKDALISIEYPTGGATKFYYESNTYAYLGSDLIEDYSPNDWTTSFDENPANFTYQTLGNNIPAVNYDRNIEIFVDRYICSDFLTMYENVGALSLKKIDSNGVIVDSYSLGPTIVNENYGLLCENIKIKLEAGFSYNLIYSWFLIGQFVNPCPSIPLSQQPPVIIKEKIRNNQTIQELFGGGFRVKTINYILDNNLSDSFSNRIKSKEFVYLHPEGNAINKRSSGSLVFQKPSYEYFVNRRFKRKFYRGCGDDIGNVGGYSNNTYTTIYDPLLLYKVLTSFDNVSTITTQGAHIGYKYVKVFDKIGLEIANGVSEYTYTSPIDNPETLNQLATKYPFVSLPNRDYKRGLLKKAVIKDKFDNILQQTDNDYQFLDETFYTGFTTYYKDYDCPHTSSFINYDQFKNGMDDAIQDIAQGSGFSEQGIRDNPEIAVNLISYVNTNNNNLLNCICCGVDSKDFIGIHKNQEIAGISQQTESITKTYFYQDSNVYDIEKETLYFYNQNNYQVNRTVISSNNDVTETKIYYPLDNEINDIPFISNLVQKNMVTVPLKTEVSINNILISTQKTHYNLDTNQLLLPKYVYTKKGNENAVVETLNVDLEKYDSYGNLLSVSQPNGMKISYIWGYNHTQPVAKIENMAYSAIPANLITAIHNATTESTLNTALNSLRNSSALANAMVTTYVYKPLVGVTKITDPKGDVITYDYDEFNRLKAVKDKNGKLLSENEYHYRTQQQP